MSLSALESKRKKLTDMLLDDKITKNAYDEKYLIVQREGERQIQREVIHYNLQMIIAAGFKINNQRAVRFLAWADQIPFILT